MVNLNIYINENRVACQPNPVTKFHNQGKWLKNHRKSGIIDMKLAKHG